MPWEVEVSDPVRPLKRLHVLRAAILFAGAMLLCRLWWVQIACGNSYEQQATGMRLRHIPLRAPRGLIYDRNGLLLSTTVPEYMVVVDPIDLRRLTAEERGAIFDKAANIIGMSVAEMQDILNRRRDAGFDTIKLKSGVGPAVITHLLEDSNELPGVGVQQVPVRYYPMGAVAAHVLGYLGDVTAADLKKGPLRSYNGADQVGEQGLERNYESQLRGVDGERVVEVNAQGVPVPNQDESQIPPTPGDTLVLNLDARLQQTAQQAFPSGMSGSVAAVDVRTGAVLALASVPSFNPNVFVQDTPEAHQARYQYLTDSNGPMQDRAVLSRYPPGSTFKIVTATSGFMNGDIDPKAIVYCAGGMWLSKHVFKKCWSFHGDVDYMEAMAKSCDTYFYNLMKRLASSQLAATARQFGLGQNTGIDLSNESRGFIPSPAWKAKRFKNGKWWFGDSCNMAIGQGFIQVTPLQMALATAAVANGGKVMRPYLVQEIRSSQGKVLQRMGPHANSVVPDAHALEMVREGMRAAVVPGGTAGIVRFSDLDVAGKTGSAQDLPNPKTHAWFVCFAPYVHPRIAICVMVEHGGHGGTEAGPVARAMLEEYFHLKNEDNNESIKTD